MRFVIAPLLLAALTAGCSSVVAGSGSALPTSTTPTTTTATTTTTTKSPPTTKPTRTPTPPPTAIDESAPAQYCTHQFTGALGKPMLAVVVETPAGRLTCDRAEAVLVDYYTQRSDPTTGLPPLAVGDLSCNQIPEGSLAQVVCSDGDDLVYSMWPQR